MPSIEEFKEIIDKDVHEHPILLYMKGSKLMPRCGFSARVVQILNELEIPFEARDVLSDDNLRQAIKEYSDWPTIPQLYIDAEFIGGCDIVTQLYEQGELQKILVGLLSNDSNDM